MQIDYLKPKQVELKRLTHKEVKALSKNDIIEYIDGKRGNLTISTYQLLVAELNNRSQRFNTFLTAVAALTGVLAVLPIVLSWF